MLNAEQSPTFIDWWNREWASLSGRSANSKASIIWNAATEKARPARMLTQEVCDMLREKSLLTETALRTLLNGDKVAVNATDITIIVNAALGEAKPAPAIDIDYSIEKGDTVYGKHWGEGLAPLEVVSVNWALRAVALKLSPIGGIVVWPAAGLTKEAP